MSTPVQSSLADLKASTAQLVGIIAGARHIPAGSVDVQLALTKQVTTLLADIIRAHEKGEYIPGIVVSCSKELMRQVRAWEALGDNSCDLPVVPNPSTGPLTVNLPSPPVPSPTPVPSPAPVIPSPPVVAGPSGKTGTEFRDKGKGKAVSVDLEPEVGGSNKRKSPMISGHSSQPPKSAMKGRKRVKSTRLPKSKPFVESEDDEDPIVQPISRRVPEVVLPQLSTIVVRTPQLPRSPGSPKKQSFGPASLTAGRRPEVMATSGSRPEVEESSDDTSSASDGDPPANTTFDITIPWPEQPLPLLRQGGLALREPVLTRGPTSPACLASAAPPRRSNATLHLWDPRPNGPREVQSRGRSKTITTKKTPAPAPAPAPAPVRSSSFAVPRAALDVPMPDLHSMAIAIRDGAARIAILEARSLRRTVVDRHPSFSLPDTPADATILLDQSGPHPSISPLPSALSNLIDLDISVMQPTPLTVEDGSAMVGLMVEPTQVQPEGPQSSGEIVLPDEPGNLLPESSGNIVVPNEPGNLLPEYDSSDEELDVEGKVDLPGEEVEMAT
ncbi:uncharacterized protein F5147DRAFT_764907 [Suillus discolor]|uniref:Uncharacterized protein n=1 Tax=Suillus discolor TaxID=1912936 RepID=A0A9P7ESZ1_9AGAM|nr:uncharacterized protein F5147DRAFT_764907 [Suillus discolor]KAG2086753.1 hypothetical protein F5147DRAFT_764907 [Suillus discolor]